MSAGTAGSLGKSWKILLREDVPGGGGEAPAETVNHLGIPWLIMTQLYIYSSSQVSMGDYSTVPSRDALII